MIIVMKLNVGEAQVNQVKEKLHQRGYRTHLIYGTERLVIGAIGRENHPVPTGLETMPGVEKVVNIMVPYKLVSREAKQENTVIDVGDISVGSEEVIIMAGPCAVESFDQIYRIARGVREGGAHFLRGGAFKPRSSPYSFQGLEEEGLKFMAEVRKKTGMKIVTEAITPGDIELIDAYADIIQVGARNMQNYALLKELGRCRKPILLKRGLASTIEEWLMSAEYILNEGNYRVILCERGIRTFENYTRNTLDISSIPIVKKLSHLPIIVDPSHSAGDWSLVFPLAKAAIAAGADGIIVEVHHNPGEALCDGSQSLTLESFRLMMNRLPAVAAAVDRKIVRPSVGGVINKEEMIGADG
ncbi:MAG: 3-deoxy-7-phosphoheptulonate synthase [Dethiobacteria bacterium]